MPYAAAAQMEKDLAEDLRGGRYYQDRGIDDSEQLLTPAL